MVWLIKKKSDYSTKSDYQKSRVLYTFYIRIIIVYIKYHTENNLSFSRNI